MRAGRAARGPPSHRIRQVFFSCPELKLVYWIWILLWNEAPGFADFCVLDLLTEYEYTVVVLAGRL